MPNTDTFAFMLGESEFQACQLTESFLGNKVRPIVARAAGADRNHETIHGAIIRVHAWLRTIGKLNHPGDFQAILAASRALFEIAVDLTLIAGDPTNPCAKLIAWEDSAKLKAADRLDRFVTAHPGAKPIGAEPVLDSLKERKRVVALRQQYWGGKHPMQRWTGGNLEQDAKAADGLDHAGFEEYYCARYDQVCWNVHGSGLAGVRFLPEDHFPGLSAFGMRDCVHFALVAARKAIQICGKWDTISELRFQEFAEELTKNRVSVYVSRGEPEA